MYQLQIVDSAGAQIAADDNRLSELPIPAARGVIFDRYDEILARNVPAYVVRITPANLPADSDEELAIFNRISALTGVPPTRAIADASGERVRSIEELVAEGEGIAPFRPVVIAQDVPLEVALRIREEQVDLPGVDLLEAAVRQYPTGAVSAHIVGYMGPIGPDEAQALIELGYDPAFDRVGYAGIEASLQEVLAGRRGTRLREVDVAGEEITLIRQIDPVDGQNVRLTIDLELQAAAEQAVRDRINFMNEQARSIITQNGAVIVMDPNTGELLAMVSWPTYDNARFARAIDGDYYFDLLEDPARPLVNQTISGVYPPGSTWKLLTSTAVLQENVIDPDSTLFDGGDLVVPNLYATFDRAADQRFVCWNREGHGPQNLVSAIANSCNVYFYQVGGGNPEVSTQILRDGGLNIDDLFRYATALGIGSELGIELPGERASFMPNRDWKRINRGENWSTGDTYNAAVGQGYINVTPLQLTTAISAIVNGGTLYKPTVVREYLDAERNITRPFTPQVLRTLNLNNVNADGSLQLLLLEDMIIQRDASLACTCEPGTNFYNPSRCNPDNYRASVDIDPDPFLEDIREYTVVLPEDYVFNRAVCDPIQWDENYTPAFVSPENLDIVRQGMRGAVTFGTAQGANLPYVTVAGKTGTAEYCDDIARPLGLCVPGNWPSHAWFAGFAPFENPEVLVVAFVYNGDEGSQNALPIVVETLEAYYRLQEQRGGPTSLASGN
ncbi:MAG: hypothetical protein OHK0046_05730 [Anaerolineae bacterium]